MEIFNATISRSEKTTALALEVYKNKFSIVLTDDNPNNIKNVFNSLLKELKKGEYNFQLVDSTEDLFFHISKEYIKQLNAELSAVFKELKDLNLLELNSPKAPASKSKSKSKKQQT